MKQLLALGFLVFTFVSFTAVASAHVVVKPAQVLTGSFQTFTMGVPNEKDAATTKMKLVIPSGLQYVSPTVKTGWTITTEKQGEGEGARITSITWEAGSIPSGFRDDFTFSAKVPDAATNLSWKAYQTYDNGVTLAWDQAPTKEEKDDDSAPVGPFSVTAVVKDTSSSNPTAATDSNNTPKYISIAALVVSLAAFAAATRKKRA